MDSDEEEVGYSGGHLGVLSAPLKVSDDNDPRKTKAGGVPVWLVSAPPEEMLKCPTCASHLTLLIQVYTPLHEFNPPLDRTMYVFGCNSVECCKAQSSWKVFRQQKPVVATMPAESVERNTSEDWGGSTDWGTPSQWNETSSLRTEEKQSQGSSLFGGGNWDQPAASTSIAPREHLASKSSSSTLFGAVEAKVGLDEELDKLLNIRDELKESKVETKREKKEKAKDGKDNVGGGSLPSWSVSVVPEPSYSLDVGGDDDYVKQLIKKYEEEEDVLAKEEAAGSNTTSGSAGVWNEEYEEDEAKDFLRFQRAVQAHPGQALRYAFGGQAIWPYRPDKLDVGKCKCGRNRVFEFQLMPNLLYKLRVGQYAGENNSGMEYGTVGVFVCPESCSNLGDTCEEFIFWTQAE